MSEVDESKYDSGNYENQWFETSDGIKLNYRVYGKGKADSPAIIAVPGLTRCARDIDAMASLLGLTHRIYAINLRGRDLSGYDPNYSNYNTLVYIRDIYEFWKHTGEKPVVLLGSSLGALLAMLMVEDHPDMLAGTVLNDLGATIEMAGMSRIFGYAGHLSDEEELSDVVKTVKSHVCNQFVDLPEEKWERMALSMYGRKNGKWHHRYDDNLGKALAENVEAPRDLWIAHKCAADLNLPVLSIRGELSDVTSPVTIQAMKEMAPNMQSVEVPKRGHCPILDEPRSLDAICRFMEQFAHHT
ncbi:alpha/beta hydrolase [Pseudovibrio sp. Tun.PSC04-5.I4]|uniref:alpha/beta fold hydrolase n=1 Tax=Pseudovibrio sp. Tun.PSC04-5.I4 TaxID=1798213 RepID=UPI00088CF75C|nr:alpha/beta hydrolase [Pseudovibrio sp. Tun.PSC04-5.I4]SDQ16487.1 Pimeloyl-ACP methyl ester carboxylesterase [Pseudovibrio sp. Tun.PSC04-5.I4]